MSNPSLEEEIILNRDAIMAYAAAMAENPRTETLAYQSGVDLHVPVLWRDHCFAAHWRCARAQNGKSLLYVGHLVLSHRPSGCRVKEWDPSDPKAGVRGGKGLKTAERAKALAKRLQAEVPWTGWATCTPLVGMTSEQIALVKHIVHSA